MRKRLWGIALVMTVVCLGGCSKDDEVKAVVADFTSFTNELVGKVENAKSPSAGVDEAQKLLDSRKAELQSKLDGIKGVRGFQVSKETMEKMTNDLVDSGTKVASLQMKYMQQSIADPAFKAKLEKLVDDYTGLLKM
jgi:hypothetical protein